MYSRELYFEKMLPDVYHAAALIEPGEAVCCSMMDGIPHTFLDALSERADILPNLTVFLGTLGREVKLLPAQGSSRIVIEDYFFGEAERGMPALRGISYVPSHLSDFPSGMRGRKRYAAVLTAAGPDNDGNFSTGPVPFEPELLKGAAQIILQVDSRKPFIYGRGRLIPLEKISAFYYLDEDLEPTPLPPPACEDRAIAQLIAELVPDGACIQLGIGRIGALTGSFLKDKRDLGIHSEIFTDTMVDLIQCGAVNNSRKQCLPGKSVFGASLTGSRAGAYLDRNPSCFGAPFSWVNDPRIIAKNRNVVSVNGALQIDLYGQVCAESLGFRQISGTGGQADFVRGAAWSEGGMSFIAAPSCWYDRNGVRHSRITLALSPGSAVTTPRSDTHYVVTEYGAANLRGKTLDARARLLISLAHPDFRDELTFEARRAGLII